MTAKLCLACKRGEAPKQEPCPTCESIRRRMVAGGHRPKKKKPRRTAGVPWRNSKLAKDWLGLEDDRPDRREHFDIDALNLPVLPPRTARLCLACKRGQVPEKNPCPTCEAIRQRMLDRAAKEAIGGAAVPEGLLIELDQVTRPEGGYRESGTTRVRFFGRCASPTTPWDVVRRARVGDRLLRGALRTWVRRVAKAVRRGLVPELLLSKRDEFRVEDGTLTVTTRLLGVVAGDVEVRLGAVRHSDRTETADVGERTSVYAVLHSGARKVICRNIDGQIADYLVQRFNAMREHH